MQFAITNAAVTDGFREPLGGGDTLWLRAKSRKASDTVLVHRFFANAGWVPG